MHHTGKVTDTCPDPVSVFSFSCLCETASQYDSPDVSTKRRQL